MFGPGRGGGAGSQSTLAVSDLATWMRDVGESDEFFDLADARMLNGESAHGGQPQTAWGNLGDWSEARTYPAACEALARRLGTAAGLSADTRVFDVGFGCGDQLLCWLDHFGVRELGGVNLSASQTRLAKARLRAAGHTRAADAVRQGSADQCAKIAGPDPWDVVLALDCAYHFPSRERFSCQAAGLVAPGGKLALFDLVCGDAAQPWHRHALLSAMGRAAHFPAHNQVPESVCRAQLRRAGWTVTEWQNLTPQVFEPFADWLVQYRGSPHAPSQPASSWLKYRATARFLRWAQRHDVLRAVVCVAERMADGPMR